MAAGAAPAVHAQSTLRWRIASSFPKSLDTLFGVCEVFAKKVGELSGGKFTVSTHAAGELMPAFGVLDGVSNGTIEMANTASYYFFGKDPTYALDCAVPFGLNSRQMTAWMYEGNGLKLLREHFAKVGIVNFPMGNTGVQMGGWYRKEINSVRFTRPWKKARLTPLNGLAPMTTLSLVSTKWRRITTTLAGGKWAHNCPCM